MFVIQRVIAGFHGAPGGASSRRHFAGLPLHEGHTMSRFKRTALRHERVRRHKPRRVLEWEEDRECDWETGQPMDDDVVVRHLEIGHGGSPISE
jgi:hypothetical protein